MEKLNAPSDDTPNVSIKKNNFILNKNIIFISIFAFLFIGTILISQTENKIKQKITPTPVIKSPTISPFPLPTISKERLISTRQKTAPGEKINPKVLEKQPDYLSKEKVSESRMQYNFVSEIKTRPNTIITLSDSTVLFERQLLPPSPKTQGYTTLSQLRAAHGDPEVVIKGSKFYDWYIETYIYASKGFAVIGNPNTNEAYEIHLFIPASTDDYINTFGEDLSPGAKSPVEGI